MTRERYGVALAFLAVVIFLNLPTSLLSRIRGGSRDLLMPFQNVLGTILEWIPSARRASQGPEAATSWRDRALWAEAKVQEGRRELAVLRQENERLRRLLQYRTGQSHALVLCRVIARGDATGWWHTLRLDQGSEAGLRPDLPVVTTEGLVGRTAEVSRHTCEVQLLSDPAFRVACRFPRTGTTGIVRGGGAAAGAPLEILAPLQPLWAEYMARAAELKPGDQAVSSGLGGVFPEGIPVGHIRRVTLDASGLYQRAELIPAADLMHLDYVLVMLPRWGSPEFGGGSKGGG